MRGDASGRELSVDQLLQENSSISRAGEKAREVEIDAYNAWVEALEPHQERVEELNAQVKLCTFTVANDGSSKVTTVPKMKAPSLQPSPRLGVQGRLTTLYGDSGPILGQWASRRTLKS